MDKNGDRRHHQNGRNGAGDQSRPGPAPTPESDPTREERYHTLEESSRTSHSRVEKTLDKAKRVSRRRATA